MIRWKWLSPSGCILIWGLGSGRISSGSYWSRLGARAGCCNSTTVTIVSSWSYDWIWGPGEHGPENAIQHSGHGHRLNQTDLLSSLGSACYLRQVTWLSNPQFLHLRNKNIIYLMGWSWEFKEIKHWPSAWHTMNAQQIVLTISEMSHLKILSTCHMEGTKKLFAR